MTRFPRGVRRTEDEQLLRRPPKEPGIKSDTITPTVEGYFRLPAVWIGDRPDDESVLTFDPLIHHSVVIDRDLDCGIKVRAYRDGTFLFDFSTWRHAPQIEIPGYRHPGPGKPHRQPTETEVAVDRSEKFAVLRAQVMNVHQACIASSQMILNRSSSGMGLPLISPDALKGLTFNECLHHRNNAYIRSLARNALNNADGVVRQKPLHRHVLETRIIDCSFNLLDQVLLNETPVLVQMIEATYLAGCRYAEGRLGEAVILAWGVCEQLISAAWSTLIDDERRADRMPKKRREKFVGRDYTASVKVEILRLGMRLEADLYEHLELARKARNDWAHQMREPDSGQVQHAIRAIEGLLQKVHGIELPIPLNSPSPGVPGWHIWIWEQRTKGGQSV